MEVTNRYITIKTQVDGDPKESDFELRTSNFSLQSVLHPGSIDIVVKNLYVSIDPAQINRMKTKSSSQKVVHLYVSRLPSISVIVAYGVAKVVASGIPEFEKDDLVVGFITWGEYSLLKRGEYILRKFDPMGFPLSYQVGVLGISGLAAYGGFFEVCKPKNGEKVLVSAASGSVGSLVGQYAKLTGCYVVGSAGSKEKVALLKEKLGFDDAFNYKEEPDLKSALQRYFPEGIDIYFDNVGGEMLEAAVVNMNAFGRVAACGVISEYLDATKRAAPNMLDVVYKRIKIQGFLAVDHMNVFSDFLSTTTDLLRAGKLHALEDISEGLESIPLAFIGLFQGHNTGKKMVKIADE